MFGHDLSLRSGCRLLIVEDLITKLAINSLLKNLACAQLVNRLAQMRGHRKPIGSLFF
jgi:hypothetical protein